MRWQGFHPNITVKRWVGCYLGSSMLMNRDCASEGSSLPAEKWQLCWKVSAFRILSQKHLLKWVCQEGVLLKCSLFFRRLACSGGFNKRILHLLRAVVPKGPEVISPVARDLLSPPSGHALICQGVTSPITCHRLQQRKAQLRNRGETSKVL